MAFSLGCSILLRVAENTKYQRHFGSFEQFLLTSGFYGDFYAKKKQAAAITSARFLFKYYKGITVDYLINMQDRINEQGDKIINISD